MKGEELSEEEIQASADKLLFGEPYFLSYDKKALILNAIPNFTLMERDLIMVAAETVQSLVDDLLKDFPDVEAGLTGQIAREHDEQIHSQRSIAYTTIIALIAILIFLMISFRMWVAPFLAVANLIVGLIWAMGTAYIVDFTDNNVGFRFYGFFIFPSLGPIRRSTLSGSGSLLFDDCNYFARNSWNNRKE